MRLFDHLDLRVRDLPQAERFYAVLLPALGFPHRGRSPMGIVFEADGPGPKPAFIGLIEDPAHRPNATRIAFWQDTREGVDRVAGLLAAAGATEIEGPDWCPEYSPTYYAVYFNDPCGNRLELCCRTARPAP